MERWVLDQPASSRGLLVWRSGGPGAAIAWVRTPNAYIDVEELEQRARQAANGLLALADDTISEEPPLAREGRCRKRLKLATEKQPVRTSVPEQQAAHCDAATAPTTADGTGQQRMRGRPRAAKGKLGKPTSGGQRELHHRLRPASFHRTMERRRPPLHLLRRSLRFESPLQRLRSLSRIFTSMPMQSTGSLSS